MSKIIEKTVVSKYAPHDTNVDWLDVSGDKPVKKSYINGKWVEVGGGGVDYSDVENKPQINGIELTGNKSTLELGIYANTQKLNVNSSSQGQIIIPFNAYCKCGTLTRNTTFSLLTLGNSPLNPIHDYDNVIIQYTWSFDIGQTVYDVTWPTYNNKALSWVNGEEPEIEANKHYEISVIDGYATYVVFDLIQ